MTSIKLMAKKKFTRKNICLIGWDINMEQLIFELSFFGMIVILIGLRLWGDKK